MRVLCGSTKSVVVRIKFNDEAEAAVIKDFQEDWNVLIQNSNLKKNDEMKQYAL